MGSFEDSEIRHKAKSRVIGTMQNMRSFKGLMMLGGVTIGLFVRCYVFNWPLVPLGALDWLWPAAEQQ